MTLSTTTAASATAPTTSAASAAAPAPASSVTNVILAGVGGQGTVLAAKVLAAAADRAGLAVRSAETIGMSQRGGSVVSHVRMAQSRCAINASLVMRGTADLVIAFEPGEAARVLPYLAPTGVLVTATTPMEPVSASLARMRYDTDVILEGIRRSLEGRVAEKAARPALVAVDDGAIIARLGGNRKVLNSVMLAKAVQTGALPFNIEELERALAACVKPQFVEMNHQAIKEAVLTK